MRGLDTNVLVRYVVADDPEQSALVKELFERAEAAKERFFVSSIALCELAWVLRSAPYHLDRSAVAAVLASLLGTSLFEIQYRDLTRRALADFQAGPADFSDYLLGWLSWRAGCKETITFDRKLKQTAGFTMLA